MSLFGGIFSKDIKQTSNTQNTDNSRVTTLTDSLNTNLNLTRADSRIYNSAFDAIDSFNTSSIYNIVGTGSNPSAAPALDYAGIRSLFTTPGELAELVNANRIDADPNANKYNFDFDSQTAAGNDFLKGVQDLVRSGWEGIASVGPNNSSTSSLMKWVLIGGAIFLAILLFLKFRK